VQRFAKRWQRNTKGLAKDYREIKGLETLIDITVFALESVSLNVKQIERNQPIAGMRLVITSLR